MSALDRLALFIDYQNAYRGAREAFGEEHDHHVVGQFDPMRLAKLIQTGQPRYPGARPRKLVSVDIYRGMPSSGKDRNGYASARRQVSRWNSLAANGTRLDVHTRTLDYRMGKPREKGIDVLLALDLAFGAAAKDFDVVVLFSGDSDLLPALERAHDSGVACETAVWVGGGRNQPKKDYLRWEHRFGQLDYDAVHDSFDYRR